MGVAYLFCSGLVQYNNQPWGNEDALLVFSWPTTASLQTWCVLRLGTTGCVHLCVSLRLEIRFGFKYAQICGLPLLLLYRGSLSLAPGGNATMRLFYTRNKFLIYVLELLLYGSSDSVVRTVLEAAMLGQRAASLFSPQPQVYSTTSRHPFRFFKSAHCWNFPDEIIQFSHFPSLISCWPSQWRLQSVPIWSRISRNRENFVIKACWK